MASQAQVTSARPADAGHAAARDLVASVVVPVRNGGGDLRELIALLEAQTIPRSRFEIVVGDDGSSDRGSDGLATPDGWVRVSPGPPINAYAARNRATRLTNGPVLAFVDADCRPDRDWLEAGLAALEHAELVAGLIRFRVPERRTVWTLVDMDTFCDQERLVARGSALTGNLFVRRELFDRVGGFDDSLPGHGDYDFAQRCVAAGARLAFDPAAAVSHPTYDERRPFLRKVWEMNRSYAERERRAGRFPDGLKLRNWVPLVQPLRARRRYGRSLGLDRRRLTQNGVRPRLRDDLRTFPVMYVLMPYLSGLAQLRGWRDARRPR